MKSSLKSKSNLSKTETKLMRININASFVLICAISQWLSAKFTLLNNKKKVKLMKVMITSQEMANQQILRQKIPIWQHQEIPRMTKIGIVNQISQTMLMKKLRIKIKISRISITKGSRSCWQSMNKSSFAFIIWTFASVQLKTTHWFTDTQLRNWLSWETNSKICVLIRRD